MLEELSQCLKRQGMAAKQAIAHRTMHWSVAAIAVDVSAVQTPQLIQLLHSDPPRCGCAECKAVSRADAKLCAVLRRHAA